MVYCHRFNQLTEERGQMENFQLDQPVPLPHLQPITAIPDTPRKQMGSKLEIGGKKQNNLLTLHFFYANMVSLP